MRPDDVMATLVHHCVRAPRLHPGGGARAQRARCGTACATTVSSRCGSTSPDRPAPLVLEAWASGAPDARADGRRRPARPRAARRRTTWSSPRSPSTARTSAWPSPSGVAAPTPASPRRRCRRWPRRPCTPRSALRNARLLGEIERLATRDSLTGLANRRLFDESLQREAARAAAARARRSASSCSTSTTSSRSTTRYGHQTGDAVLREVADALVANTKNFDVAARYGGDEFVVLLPGCSRRRRDAAWRSASAARSPAQVGEAPVTISAGIATMPDNAVRRRTAHGRGRRRARTTPSAPAATAWPAPGAGSRWRRRRRRSAGRRRSPAAPEPLTLRAASAASSSHRERAQLAGGAPCPRPSAGASRRTGSAAASCTRRAGRGTTPSARPRRGSGRRSTCTSATTCSPKRSSGTPTTTQSNTLGCLRSSASTSSGYTFSPAGVDARRAAPEQLAPCRRRRRWRSRRARSSARRRTPGRWPRVFSGSLK